MGADKHWHKLWRDKRLARINEYKVTLSCARCNYSFKEYPVCCDFHNPDREREHTSIGALFRHNANIGKIFEEIKKCIPLCSNCHRIEHQENGDHGLTIKPDDNNDVNLTEIF